MSKTKHIVIDARLYGPKNTGIGRYTKNLLFALKNLPGFKKYNFTLIVQEKSLSEVKSDLGNSFNYFSVNIPHYSLKEQLILPIILYKLKPDLVHFTHFNKPILYLKNSLVTIHDLIKHISTGRETTTQNMTIYWLKHFGYRLISRLAIKTSKIIVPSNYWRQYIIKKYQLKPDQITTTYEAVDPTFLNLKAAKIDKPQNYLVYTGNLYPHKNIQVVLKALQKLPDIKLKIISARSVFSQRAESLIKKFKLQNQVEFLGFVPDSDFPKIYSHSLALVHPSFLEGFSLTGLEAMSLNTPVISSNSSCLPEIYQDSVLYFDPNNAQNLVNQIMILKDNPILRQNLIKKGLLQVAKYSWTKTALQTYNVYQNSI